MPDSIRLLLADDHTLVRAGIRAILSSFDGVQVVAETGNGLEVMRLIEMHRPDLVLLDIAMPGLNGLEVAAQIAQTFPQVRVIILSMYINEEYVLRALQSGAAGYLLKDADTAELELAVRAVARGETYLSSIVSRRVIDDYLQRVSGEPGPAVRLTPRQRQVLQLIAEGRTTREIAGKLDISVKTVETHRVQLMDELDIHDIAGLVRYAIRIGLVSPEQ
jgi:DNA-binding NarL/FixJ family response regulator